MSETRTPPSTKSTPSSTAVKLSLLYLGAVLGLSVVIVTRIPGHMASAIGGDAVLLETHGLAEAVRTAAIAPAFFVPFALPFFVPPTERMVVSNYATRLTVATIAAMVGFSAMGLLLVEVLFGVPFIGMFLDMYPASLLLIPEFALEFGLPALGCVVGMALVDTVLFTEPEPLWRRAN